MNKTTNKFSPKVRQPAIRMVLDHEAEHRRGGQPFHLLRARSVARQPRCMNE